MMVEKKNVGYLHWVHTPLRVSISLVSSKKLYFKFYGHIDTEKRNGIIS